MARGWDEWFDALALFTKFQYHFCVGICADKVMESSDMISVLYVA